MFEGVHSPMSMYSLLWKHTTIDRRSPLNEGLQLTSKDGIAYCRQATMRNQEHPRSKPSPLWQMHQRLSLRGWENRLHSPDVFQFQQLRSGRYYRKWVGTAEPTCHHAALPRVWAGKVRRACLEVAPIWISEESQTKWDLLRTCMDLFWRQANYRVRLQTCSCCYCQLHFRAALP